MDWAVEQGRRRRRLDYLAGIHHDHAVRLAGDQPQVVRNQHDGHPQLLLEAAQQLEDLGLDRDVERRGGLVGDEHLGVAHERHRDHDTLAHAAGQLMRVLVHAFRGVGDADERQHLDGARARGLAGQVLMDDRGLCDLIADREDGVERRHRLLKHHGDLVAADGAQVGGGEGQQVAPLELDDAAGQDVAGRLGDEAQDRE